MIKKLSNIERKSMDCNCFKDYLLDEEMFLYNSVEICSNLKPKFERNAYNHSTNLEELKDLYQNLSLVRFIEGINYNPDVNVDGLDLFEVIELKRKDFEFTPEQEKAFSEFEEIIKTEPEGFDELKEYVSKTSKLLEKCGSLCEASLHESFLDAFDRMLDDYSGIIPCYQNDIIYVKENSTLWYDYDNNNNNYGCN